MVLVTGGAKGIGRMISEAFVRNGAAVYISSRNADACRKVVSELNALGTGRADYIPANLYEENDCVKLVEELAMRENSKQNRFLLHSPCPETNSRPLVELHILVNNSGATWGAPYDDYPSAVWSKVLTLNIQRVFTITQLLTPLLERAASPNDPGRVINIGSVNGLTVTPRETFAYSASKAGLHHLSRVLANHLGKRNIT